MDKDYNLKLVHCKIRPSDEAAPERPKSAWRVDIGIFKDYLRERKSNLLTQCFEEDWKNMKPLKYKKSEAADIKRELAKVYGLIKSAYRESAGVNPSGSVFSVSPN